MTDESIEKYRQALWDIFRILGGDTDGDPTPAAVVGDFSAMVIELAQETREALDESYNDDLLPPFTEQEYIAEGERLRNMTSPPTSPNE